MSNLPWWGLTLGIAVAGILAVKLSGCSHDGPLALLPATRTSRARAATRWFCDECGKTWAANFDKVQTPVRKFTGYDESKAVNAAKRASDLVDRQRALALQRAGMRPAATTRKPKAAPEPVHVPDHAGHEVVPIGRGRRVAG
jgi:hypothetical protein